MRFKIRNKNEKYERWWTFDVNVNTHFECDAYIYDTNNPKDMVNMYECFDKDKVTLKLVL